MPGINEKESVILYGRHFRMFFSPNLAVVTIQFEQSEYSFVENQTETSVCVILRGATDIGVAVNVQLGDGGSALLGNDFQFSPTTITFQPSTDLLPESKLCLNVSVDDDGVIEAAETFFLTLSSNASDGVIIALAEAEVTVLDSTLGPVAFLNSSTTVAEGDNVLLCFTNPLSFERNVTLQITFESFGGE
jgi:hypothetical protein